ncbi:MAG: PEP-utilizing enzyme [Microthrixaceae bacterium]
MEGLAIGEVVATGEVCRLDDASEIDRFRDGSILVTSITDPDWEPIMKRAAAIVTDHGGRTSHAAIVSRELESQRSSAPATPPRCSRRARR